jgi:hypothetical protein
MYNRSQLNNYEKSENKSSMVKKIIEMKNKKLMQTSRAGSLRESRVVNDEEVATGLLSAGNEAEETDRFKRAKTTKKVRNKSPRNHTSIHKLQMAKDKNFSGIRPILVDSERT